MSLSKYRWQQSLHELQFETVKKVKFRTEPRMKSIDEVKSQITQTCSKSTPCMDKDDLYIDHLGIGDGYYYETFSVINPLQVR